jgi:hypothetical protein
MTIFVGYILTERPCVLDSGGWPLDWFNMRDLLSKGMMMVIRRGREGLYIIMAFQVMRVERLKGWKNRCNCSMRLVRLVSVFSLCHQLQDSGLRCSSVDDIPLASQTNIFQNNAGYYQ